jgi:hypothetical protein
MGQRKVIQCLHDEKAERKRKENSSSENTTASGESDRGREEHEKTGRCDGARTKVVPLKPHPSLQARKR